MKGRMKCPRHPDVERRALMMKRDPVVRLGSEMFERLQATATTTTKKKNVTTGRTQRRLASEVLERLQATATTAMTTMTKNVTTSRPQSHLVSEVLERLQATATKNVTTSRTQSRLASGLLERLQSEATVTTASQSVRTFGSQRYIKGHARSRNRLKAPKRPDHIVNGREIVLISLRISCSRVPSHRMITCFMTSRDAYSQHRCLRHIQSK
jgi:hypothetical protein